MTENLIRALVIQGFLLLIPIITFTVLRVCILDKTYKSDGELKRATAYGFVATFFGVLMFFSFCSAVWVSVLAS